MKRKQTTLESFFKKPKDEENSDIIEQPLLVQQLQVS